MDDRHGGRGGNGYMERRMNGDGQMERRKEE